jgi:hypothetical protein
MHHAQYAAALQQEVGTGSQETGTKSDLPDIANLQRLLQMQHQYQQNPMLALLNSSAGNGLSAGLLAQLEGFSGANRNSNSTPADQQGPDIAALANAQSLLGYVNSNNNQRGVAGNPTFIPSDNQQQSLSQHSGVSDAFALLTRHMQRDNNGNNNQHGFGGNDRQG